MVSGVDSSRPTGPHSQYQNAAAISRATGRTPTFWPYSTGSRKWW
jgi:hypothetical protein